MMPPLALTMTWFSSISQVILREPTQVRPNNGTEPCELLVVLEGEGTSSLRARLDLKNEFIGEVSYKQVALYI